MKNGIVKVDPQEVAKLANEAGKLVFKKEAETELIKLLELKKMIDTTIEEVKTSISKAGNDILPNFKGVRGNRVSVSITDESERMKVDREYVQEYKEKHGKLPEGILTYNVKGSVRISLKNDQKQITG